MLAFLGLALLFTWPLQIPLFLGWLPPAAELPLLALAGAGPTLAATVLTRGRIWRRLGDAPPAWAILVALVAPPLVAVTAAGLDLALGGPAVALAMPFVGSVLWPPLGEELGWRGYLHDRLADRHGPLAAGALVGLAWAFWHAPTAIGAWDRYPAFALSVVAVSIALAWLHERAGRKLWVAVAAHAGINLQLVAHRDGARPALLGTALLVAIAAMAAASLAATGRARSASAPPAAAG